MTDLEYAKHCFSYIYHGFISGLFVKEGIPQKNTKKYSKNGFLGTAATLLPPVPSFDESLTDSPNHSSCYYEIVFCVDEQKFGAEDDGEEWTLTKWYTIKVHSYGAMVYPKPLVPFWKGKVYSLESLAALGSQIYAFGGLSHDGSPQAIQDVCKLQVTPHVAQEWVPVSPMLSSRYCPETSVLGNRIYVRNGEYEALPHHWGEVFDPADGKWEALPNPPKYPVNYPECTIISAALENPKRIIVAHRAPDSFAIFYVYNVQHRSWGVLAPAKRKVRPMCNEGWLGRAVSAGNTLYSIKRPYNTALKNDVLFIAYDLNLDMWLEGCLKGHGIFFFQDYGILGKEARPPVFLHLEKQRFCLLQCDHDDYLRCVVVDVSHMP